MADEPLVDIEVLGAARLADTLNRASEGLKTLDKAHADAGAIALAQARASSPRRTGRLASSGGLIKHTNGVGITFSAPYANPIHWGWARRGIAENPWVTKAAQATENRWFDVYVSETEKVLEKVEGA